MREKGSNTGKGITGMQSCIGNWLAKHDTESSSDWWVSWFVPAKRDFRSAHLKIANLAVLTWN